MKKFLISVLAILMCIVFISCGEQSVNAEISNKIDKTVDNMSNTIKEIESINEDDILITEIMPSDISSYTALISPRVRGNSANRQIVNYNAQTENFGYSNTNAMRNVGTYNTYGKNHNVNSFAGLGESGNLPYNEINQAQYGYPYQNGGAAYQNNMPYQNGTLPNQFQNGYMPNSMYPAVNRGISNVNTYNLKTNNVNTYKNAKTIETENNTADNNLNNINSYKNETTDTEYEQYKFDENTQNQFSKLSNLYSVASTVVGVNKAINQEKVYILSTTQEIKELANILKEKEIELSESEKSSIASLLDNISSNVNKIKLSKNEIRYELEKVKTIKNNYKNLAEQLSSRYVRLSNALETRYSYYCNISTCLDQLKSQLQNCCYGTSTENIENETLNENSIENFNENLNENSIENTNEIINENKNIIENTNQSEIKQENENLTEQKVETNTLEEKLNEQNKLNGDFTTQNEEILNEETLNEGEIMEETNAEQKHQNQKFTDGFKNIETEKKEVANNSKNYFENEKSKTEAVNKNNFKIYKKYPQIKQYPDIKEKDIKPVRNVKTPATANFFPFKEPKKFDFMKVKI